MDLGKMALVMLAAICLAACSLEDDEPKDKVENVTLYVSAETGTYSPLMYIGDPFEGMQIREKGESRWVCVAFSTVDGFTYEPGYDYELLVKKTTLANPPQDASNVRYKLIRIVSQKRAS
ncbi:MAG: DUF4377 domain-containing protein [Prevotella sp.]|nr:DUF4377 domain-containing protein [Prevotella sp.]MBR1462781.1 DUF4377 domain-containing protein [Prevotella sp.]